MTKLLPTLCLCSLILSGCDGVPKFAREAPRHRLVVIPSAPPKQLFEVTVTDERYLTDVARRLGTTVEAIIADNGLPDSTIRRGQRLKVRSTEKRFKEFERLQRVREERRLQRAEAQRVKAAAKAAELLKKKHRRRVRKKRPRKRPKRRKRASQRRRQVHR